MALLKQQTASLKPKFAWLILLRFLPVIAKLCCSLGSLALLLVKSYAPVADFGFDATPSVQVHLIHPTVSCGDAGRDGTHDQGSAIPEEP